jgi:hypothetical protein
MVASRRLQDEFICYVVLVVVTPVLPALAAYRNVFLF